MEASMLSRAALAAVALAFAAPATAGQTCLEDANGAQCDVFLDRYRSDDVPVGTSDVRKTEEFVVEDFQESRPDDGVNPMTGEDVFYWDGDSGTIVPEEAGPQVEILDW
jgi:hypothetical protein